MSKALLLREEKIYWESIFGTDFLQGGTELYG